MATRTVKSDSGNDLKLQNNGGTGSVTITDAGDLTIDSPADIVLDAEGADITLKDGGTAFGTLKQASGHLVLQPTSSKEIILNDQGGTASLTVDTANQRVSINNGNIAFSTGKGIDFSNQASPAAGMTSELLDSYEEGTWTASITDGTNDMTMQNETGYYTKIGNIVTITGYFNITSVASASGDVRISGLPYNCTNAIPAYASVCVGYGSALNLGSAGQNVSGYISQNNDYIKLYVWDATTGVTTMQASEWTNTGDIIINTTYRTGS